MARNKEKQFGNLNRLYLLKEQEEYEKANPKRPKLDTLDTVRKVQKWLPSIKKDIDFYLKKSEVTCYSDSHIEECREKVVKLEKEYKAFVRKLHELSPVPIETIPWTNRPYKRKNKELTGGSPCDKFKPIATPILDGMKNSSVVIYSDIGVNKDLMDKPLNFSLGEDRNSELNISDQSDLKMSSVTFNKDLMDKPLNSSFKEDRNSELNISDQSNLKMSAVTFNKDLMDKRLNSSFKEDRNSELNVCEQSDSEASAGKPLYIVQDKLVISNPRKSHSLTDKVSLRYEETNNKTKQIVNIVDYDSSDNENS